MKYNVIKWNEKTHVLMNIETQLKQFQLKKKFFFAVRKFHSEHNVSGIKRGSFSTDSKAIIFRIYTRRVSTEPCYIIWRAGGRNTAHCWALNSIINLIWNFVLYTCIPLTVRRRYTTAQGLFRHTFNSLSLQSNWVVVRLILNWFCAKTNCKSDVFEPTLMLKFDDTIFLFRRAQTRAH